MFCPTMADGRKRRKRSSFLVAPIEANGNSADRTVEIASAYARIIRCRPCRAMQMNAGARASSGGVVVFLRADVRLGAGGLAALRDS
jgi:hypothetical protein